MKKQLLTLSLLCISGLGFSQILNGGFEQQRPSGGPAHWGKLVLMPFPCGTPQGYDSVYFQTNDAHSGQYALELRNAVCGTSYLAGGVNAMQNDTNYFSIGFPYTALPQQVYFYYKYFPQGGDEMAVTVTIEDDVNNVQMASGTINITQQATAYSLATLPLTYAQAGTPTRMTVSFGYQNAQHIHYGSRFLVDDMSDQAPTSVQTLATGKEVRLFPNPAAHNIVVTTGDGIPHQLTLVNTMGQKLIDCAVQDGQQINLDKLAPGYYFYTLTGAGDQQRHGKLLKQ